MFTTRCPSCFSLETAPSPLWWLVRSVYLNHLSMTCLSRPRVHPSCPEVRVRLKPNKKTFLYSSASSLAFPAFPPLFDPHPPISPVTSSPHPPIKGSLYCLYKGIGVVNRCRVMGSPLAARHGTGSHPSSPPPPVLL